MPTLVAFTVGLVVWIVVWAIGVSAFDAFLLVFLFVLPAAVWQIYGPAIKKMLGQTPPPSTR
jgi:hypothetical protein